MHISFNSARKAKRERLRHSPHQLQPTGVKGVTRIEVDHWVIEIASRKVGTTLKRESYNVVVEHEGRNLRKQFSGFKTQSQAEIAAREYIAKIERFHPLDQQHGPRPSKRLLEYRRRQLAKRTEG